MPRVLGVSEVKEGLKGLRGWRKKGNFLAKDFHFDDFLGGISFVDKVAKVAEKEEHHPDIHIRYTDVTLDIQTHSEGGITEWDLALARAIDQLGANGKKKETRIAGTRPRKQL